MGVHICVHFSEPCSLSQSLTHSRIHSLILTGGCSRLVELVGRRHALRLLGSSAHVRQSEAVKIGLVDSGEYNVL